MMDTKHVFTSSIENAVEGIRTSGLTQIEEVPPTSSQPTRLIRLDLWRTPATVSDYRESDFASCFSSEDCRRLTSLVTAFRELTETFDPKGPVPEAEGKEADGLVMQIHEIIT